MIRLHLSLTLGLIVPACSLVTVPVKTAGSVVKTTVKTAGSVAEAPFKAASGGYRNEEKESKKDEKDDE